MHTDIIIAGGGLAGLTAALHLQQAGLHVLIIEKNSYPQHKVCGEYISNEVLPYLQWLDADPEVLKPAAISRLQFSTVSQKSLTATLPLGGFGISRYMLDNFLYEKFVARGGTVLQDTVTSICSSGLFTVNTQAGKVLTAKQLIGAYGKRSALDLQLNRSFMSQRSPFLAVKAHYSGPFESDMVGLYSYPGGYCGVSTVEDGKLNICYLADYNSFKRYKNIMTYQEEVLFKNKPLQHIFQNSSCLFETPLTISQLAFGAREAVQNHVLMAGDTAGLIHPLCGNGMSMAIHSAKICSELLIEWFEGKISAAELEKKYTLLWEKQFRSRMKMGSMLSAILKKEHLSDILMNGFIRIPSLLQVIIRKTHGKKLTINA